MTRLIKFMNLLKSGFVLVIEVCHQHSDGGQLCIYLTHRKLNQERSLKLNLEAPQLIPTHNGNLKM